jgi:hypothetical protein
MVGIIDVCIKYPYGRERVTLSYFRSSGTNSGKIKGLWYPIVGIKTCNGRFTDFTEYLNFVLTNSTRKGKANEGWLAKSLFFSNQDLNSSIVRGFSNGKHYENLFEIGKMLRSLYEKDKFHMMNSLDATNLNSILTSKKIYENNAHSQRENFEKFIEDIYNEGKSRMLNID